MRRVFLSNILDSFISAIFFIYTLVYVSNQIPYDIIFKFLMSAVYVLNHVTYTVILANLN